MKADIHDAPRNPTRDAFAGRIAAAKTLQELGSLVVRVGGALYDGRLTREEEAELCRIGERRLEELNLLLRERPKASKPKP